MGIEIMDELRRGKDTAAADGAGKPTAAATCVTANMLVELSHELRTPLNAIIGYAAVMQDETLGPLGDPRYREYLADIDECAQYLSSLIGKIVDRARVECDPPARAG